MRDATVADAVRPLAARALAASGMGSVGLYAFDAAGGFEGGVILGMPDAFVRAYEVTGVPVDPVLAEMRRTGRPVSTATVLGARWRDRRLYHRVSGRFGLTGFAALPLYDADRVAGILHLGASDAAQAARLEGGGPCDLTVHAMQAAAALAGAPRRHPALTPRQDAVARLAAEGLTNRQIAEKLRTGEAAVRKQRPGPALVAMRRCLRPTLQAVFGVVALNS